MARDHPQRRRGQPKKITSQTLLGQRGVNLIERRLLEMGFIWYPTGGVEAGIDGHLEIRDSSSGEVLNAIVRVQSKATAELLGAPNSETFEYLCDERDLDYWMTGNAPVILVRSRPDKDEAYWVSIKDYFKDPVQRKSRSVRFDKRRDSFDLSAKRKLIALAIPQDHGVYFAPQLRRERLLSNLLPITSVPRVIYIAQAQTVSLQDISATLRSSGPGFNSQWILKSGEVLSFHDLKRDPWPKVCNPESVRLADTALWSSSDDIVKRQEYVWLLNRCLRAITRELGLGYNSEQDCFYFHGTANQKRRRLLYHAMKRESTRTVFKEYRRDTPQGVVTFFRHTAFHGRFRRFERSWFLEIAPTYFFTSDGRTPHPGYENKLKGIKALERNDAVRNHVVMWAELLSDRQSDLFRQQRQVLLQFGDLLSFHVEAGIDDRAWVGEEDESLGKSDFGEEREDMLFDDEV